VGAHVLRTGDVDAGVAGDELHYVAVHVWGGVSRWGEL